MVVKKNFKTKKSSRQFLEFFSDFLNKGQIIYLNGELGVGKTYYAKIIIKKLSGSTIVPSPTFNIINIYNLDSYTEIWHCDLYRIKTMEEINELGIFDNIQNKIILVEWPNILLNYNFEAINFNIYFGKNTYERNICIKLPSKLENKFILG